MREGSRKLFLFEAMEMGNTVDLQRAVTDVVVNMQD